MGNYNNYSKNALLNKIDELETVIAALKLEKNQQELLNFPWIGNLGNWYWNIKKNTVICNDQKILALNYTKDEIPHVIDHQFFTSRIHPDHYDAVMENMRQHLKGNTPAYEVEHKIRTKDGQWKWFYDRGIITKFDEDGSPLLMAGIVFDVTKEKHMMKLIEDQNKELMNLVNIDYLTGVLNRRALFQRLEKVINDSNENKAHLSVLMIDIDNFKSINDDYGHLAGDKVLTEVANLIKTHLSESDFVGRFGGEEFLVVFPDQTAEQAYIVAEEIRKDISSLEFTNANKITISGGIRELNSTSVDTLIDIADKALYNAKLQGKNQICVNIIE